MYTPPSTIIAPEANIALTTTMLVAATIAVAFRWYARKFQGGWSAVGADDWIMLFAYISFLTLCVLIYVGLHTKALGYTDDISVLEGAPDSTRARMTLVITMFTSLALGLIRLSALFFFRRVLDVPRKRVTPFKFALYTLMVVVVLWTITFVSFPPALCGDHIWALWTPSIEGEYCPLYHDMILATTITDLVLEVLIVLLPVPKIMSLQMSLQRRLAIIFVFLTALTSVGASAGRMAITGYFIVGPIEDIALANTAVEFMWVVETGLAMIAVNLPSLWYFHSKLTPTAVLRSVRSVLSLGSSPSKPSIEQLPRRPDGKVAGGSRAASDGGSSTSTKNGNANDSLEMANWKQHHTEADNSTYMRNTDSV